MFLSCSPRPPLSLKLHPTLPIDHSIAARAESLLARLPSTPCPYPTPPLASSVILTLLPRTHLLLLAFPPWSWMARCWCAWQCPALLASTSPSRQVPLSSLFSAAPRAFKIYVPHHWTHAARACCRRPGSCKRNPWRRLARDFDGGGWGWGRSVCCTSTPFRAGSVAAARSAGLAVRCYGGREVAEEETSTNSNMQNWKYK